MGYSITSSTDHCYPGTTVLINKLGLTEQSALDEAEKVVVPLRSVEVEQESYDGPLDFAFYMNLHRRLFGDLYDWAGTIRTIDISKKGTSFYPASELAHLGSLIFERLTTENYFCELSRDDYVHEIAAFYHSLNMLHPFREGNGRVQRLFFTLLVRRAGYEINFSQCDTDALMVATIFAAQGIMDQLIQFFDCSIQ